MKRATGRWTRSSPWLLVACLVVGGCSLGGEARYPIERQPGETAPRYEDPEGIFGSDLSFGGKQQDEDGGSSSGISVNAFLWRASLDTVSFLPIASADPFGGTIITDWYSPPQTPDERFKVNVFILGRSLRADGVRASVFRQQQDGAGGWVDAQVDPSTATDLENTILTKARQLRIQQLGE